VEVSAHCDDCQRLQKVFATGKKQREGFSAEWWQIIPHWVDGQLCPGSGKRL
jgi:hypothetical protein